MCRKALFFLLLTCVASASANVISITRQTVVSGVNTSDAAFFGWVGLFLNQPVEIAFNFNEMSSSVGAVTVSSDSGTETLGIETTQRFNVEENANLEFGFGIPAKRSVVLLMWSDSFPASFLNATEVPPAELFPGGPAFDGIRIGYEEGVIETSPGSGEFERFAGWGMNLVFNGSATTRLFNASTFEVDMPAFDLPLMPDPTIPEPSALPLLLFGIFPLLAIVRRRR